MKVCANSSLTRRYWTNAADARHVNFPQFEWRGAAVPAQWDGHWWCQWVPAGRIFRAIGYLLWFLQQFWIYFF